MKERHKSKYKWISIGTVALLLVACGDTGNGPAAGDERGTPTEDQGAQHETGPTPDSGPPVDGRPLDGGPTPERGAADQGAMDQSTMDTALSDQSTDGADADQSVTDQRPADQAAADQDAVDQSIADQALPDQGGPDQHTPDQAAQCGVCQDGDNCCGPGCTFRTDSDCPLCDPAVGVPVPMPTCSAQDPCTDLLITYTGINQIDYAVEPAVCHTTTDGISQGRTAFDDGPPRSWTDADGNQRTWCEYRPAGTSASAPRPLVIYIHGSGATSTAVYDSTNLRTKAQSFDLSGDPARPGFMLVATQGRYLHWPTSGDQDGTKHDTYHRDLSQISGNRDIAFVDHIVDTLVSEGVADPDRIYLMGWSNGGRFATLYGIARRQTTTPGGNRVAAVANYSHGDPFENVTWDQEPSCQLATYPTTDLPYYLISRSCDAVFCSEAQNQAIQQSGTATVPGNVVETWIDTLQNTMQDPNVTWVKLNTTGFVVNQCVTPSLCTLTLALLNHVHWPDGVNDNSGRDHEPEMLEFLGQHALP